MAGGWLLLQQKLQSLLSISSGLQNTDKKNNINLPPENRKHFNFSDEVLFLTEHGLNVTSSMLENHL